MTTIHQAAGRGALPLVRRLIEDQPQLVNARDQNGRTPLMHACQWGCFQVALFLLDQGAGVNRVDHAGRSALQWTAPTGASLRTIALLLERGADPSLTSQEDEGAGSSGDEDRVQAAHYKHHRHLRGGATFLMRACSFGYTQIVRLLLLHGGSDLDARDAHGRTALHYASETGKAGAAQLLLDWGADPFLRDEDGRSPLDVARMWDRRDCARVLEDWEKTYHLYRLRRMQDAVDALAELQQHQARRPPPSWLLQRVREGRPLPRVEVPGGEEGDNHHHLQLQQQADGNDARQDSDDGGSVAEQRCCKRSRPAPEGSAEGALGPNEEAMAPAADALEAGGSQHLVKARAALHFAVARRAGGLPQELFRELLEAMELGALVGQMAL